MMVTMRPTLIVDAAARLRADVVGPERERRGRTAASGRVLARAARTSSSR